MNGNHLIFKKFIVLTHGGTFKVLPARYYKPVEESEEEKPADKTARRRLPPDLIDNAGR
ncbi:MAG: hypothetical protein LBU16_08355 [Treponema sp.]|nr:hypothetical protein [Treponema sp.]